jgi:hypothetical protein
MVTHHPMAPFFFFFFEIYKSICLFEIFLEVFYSFRETKRVHCNFLIIVSIISLRKTLQNLGVKMRMWLLSIFVSIFI